MALCVIATLVLAYSAFWMTLIFTFGRQPDFPIALVLSTGCSAMFLGLGQRLVLLHYVDELGPWVFVTGVGAGAGTAFSVVFDLLVPRLSDSIWLAMPTICLSFLILGVCQISVLRRIVPRSWLWLVPHALAGLAIGAYHPIIGTLLYIGGTGITLYQLLAGRHHVQAEG